MFIGRFNIFECNGCGSSDTVKSFPEGWVFTTPKMGCVEHYCKSCQRNIPEGTRVFDAGDKEGRIIKKECSNAQ